MFLNIIHSEYSIFEIFHLFKLLSILVCCLDWPVVYFYVDIILLPLLVLSPCCLYCRDVSNGMFSRLTYCLYWPVVFFNLWSLLGGYLFRHVIHIDMLFLVFTTCWLYWHVVSIYMLSLCSCCRYCPVVSINLFCLSKPVVDIYLLLLSVCDFVKRLNNVYKKNHLSYVVWH